MIQPWLKMQLDQYVHVHNKTTKAKNQFEDAARKMSEGDMSPENLERLSKSKTEHDAYAPVKQQLESELIGT